MREKVKSINKLVGDKACRIYVYLKNPMANNKAIGVAEIVGIAAALVVGAFVLIPGFRSFAETVMTAINSWWTNTINTRIFPTS